MKIHEGTDLCGRKLTCSALSLMMWAECTHFCMFAAISSSSKLGSLPNQGERCYDSVLLPQLFFTDHPRAIHQTEKGGLSPALRQKCIVLLWDLCGFGQTSMRFRLLVELPKLYLLPCVDFG